jgi:hypothetical protein
MAKTESGKRKVFVSRFVANKDGKVVGAHYRSTPNDSGSSVKYCKTPAPQDLTPAAWEKLQPKLAQHAAEARANARANGITLKQVVDGWLCELRPDGSCVKIRKIRP